MFADLTVWEWMRTGLVVVAMPRLAGAKVGISDGREVWLSPDIYAITQDESDPVEREKIARMISVVMVDSLKHQWRRAFD